MKLLAFVLTCALLATAARANPLLRTRDANSGSSSGSGKNSGSNSGTTAASGGSGTTTSSSGNPSTSASGTSANSNSGTTAASGTNSGSAPSGTTAGGSSSGSGGNGPEFDMDSAYEALMYAYSTYCTVPHLTAWQCEWCGSNNTQGFNVTQFVNGQEHDTFGIVGVNPNTQLVVVAFRGSDNFQNWVTNLNAIKTNYPPFPSAQVHEGFLEAWQEVSNVTLNAVQEAVNNNPGFQILVTGHSLGAAMATFCAADINNVLGIDNFLLHHFGSPRVGDSTFASWFDSHVMLNDVWRMTNEADVVPHVPPEKFGFFHITTEVWRFNSGDSMDSYKVCSPTNGEDPHCSDSLAAPISIPEHLQYMGVEVNLHC